MDKYLIGWAGRRDGEPLIGRSTVPVIGPMTEEVLEALEMRLSQEQKVRGLYITAFSKFEA